MVTAGSKHSGSDVYRKHGPDEALALAGSCNLAKSLASGDTGLTHHYTPLSSASGPAMPPNGTTGSPPTLRRHTSEPVARDATPEASPRTPSHHAARFTSLGKVRLHYKPTRRSSLSGAADKSHPFRVLAPTRYRECQKFVTYGRYCSVTSMTFMISFSGD